jgi:diketogulonate reductase-like aldo/keto reductase
MNIVTKKLKNGFEIPVFGLGTWRMGGEMEYNPQNDDEADIQAIKNAIDKGITHIDTAQNYAEGHAEQFVGQAIKGYDRSKLFIVTKLHKGNLAYNDVLSTFSDSLKRLETNYVDLLLIHAPNLEIPLKDTISAMDKLVKDKLVRYIGVSNFALPRLKEAQQLSKNPIVTNQVHYNFIYREPERTGLLEYCQQNDIILTAWRPVQKGILTQKGVPVVEEMCQKYQKNPAQIAINWLVSQLNVVTLSKMGKPEHLAENLKAIDWKMDEADIERLRKDFPNQQDVSDRVPLV